MIFQFWTIHLHMSRIFALIANNRFFLLHRGASKLMPRFWPSRSSRAFDARAGPLLLFLRSSRHFDAQASSDARASTFTLKRGPSSAELLDVYIRRSSGTFDARLLLILCLAYLYWALAHPIWDIIFRFRCYATSKDVAWEVLGVEDSFDYFCCLFDITCKFKPWA
ncbi:hypothetical protein CsSME_00022342 [Camellia sinensis var. sinensis]